MNTTDKREFKMLANDFGFTKEETEAIMNASTSYNEAQRKLLDAFDKKYM